MNARTETTKIRKKPSVEAVRARGWTAILLVWAASTIVAVASQPPSTPPAEAPAEELRLRVEQAAVAAAEGQIEAPDRLELSSVRFGGADPVPAGTLDVELLEADGPNASGITQLRFRLLVDGLPRGEARASVRASVRGPALVATRTLTHGQPISPDSVERIDVDLTRLTGKPLRSPQELAGWVPVRSLGAGRAISRELLRPEPIVRRGQPVDLMVQRRGLTVTSKGMARDDGAVGETVRADDIRTGTRVLGRVRADGTLLVVRGSASRATR